MRRSKRALPRVKEGKGPAPRLDGEHLSLAEQLCRVSERLKVAEKELARLAAENARLVTENSVLRAQIGSRTGMLQSVKARRSREEI